MSFNSINKYSKLDITDRPVLSHVIDMANGDAVIHNSAVIDANFNLSSKTYTINYELDLSKLYTDGKMTLGKETVLKFEKGGKFKNGTVVGNNSTIIADRKVFENVVLKGTWNCVGDIRWFAKWSEFTGRTYNDESAGIQDALDSSFREIEFLPKAYYVANTVVLRTEKRIVMHGHLLKNSISNSTDSALNTSVIFTDKNIPILKIAATENHQNRVEIDGGNFDVSKCGTGYSSNCIEICTDNNEKMWGISIRSSILGLSSVENGYAVVNSGVGINISPKRDKKADRIENSSAELPVYPVETFSNIGYATNIHINCLIANFYIGVKATNYMNSRAVEYGGETMTPGTMHYNWCTDLEIDSNIVNCVMSVESNVEATNIMGSLQAGCWGVAEKMGKPLIKYDGTHASIGAMIFDVGLYGYNRCALSSSTANAVIDYYASFMGYVSLHPEVVSAPTARTPELLNRKQVWQA